MKRRYTAAAAMMMVMGLCASASAAFDENLNSYTLDSMIVEADATKNKFGEKLQNRSEIFLNSILMDSILFW